MDELIIELIDRADQYKELCAEKRKAMLRLLQSARSTAHTALQSRGGGIPKGKYGATISPPSEQKLMSLIQTLARAVNNLDVLEIYCVPVGSDLLLPGPQLVVTEDADDDDGCGYEIDDRVRDG